MGFNVFQRRVAGFVVVCWTSTSVLAAAPKTAPASAVSTYTVQTSTSAQPPTPILRSLPNNAFAPGEKLVFVLKWGIITAGHSSLVVQSSDTLEGRPAYHILSEARTTGIADTFYKTRDRNETWLDVQSLSTVRYEKHIREGKFKLEEVVELDQVNHRYRNFAERLDKGTTSYAEGNIPPYAMDVLGSLYYVRTVPFTVGDSFTMDVYDRKKIWPLVVKVLKREKVKVPAGKFDCYKVEPILREPGIFVNKGKKLWVWMTADDRHMPVLMRSEVAIGHVSAELVKYNYIPATTPSPETPPTTSTR